MLLVTRVRDEAQAEQWIRALRNFPHAPPLVITAGDAGAVRQTIEKWSVRRPFFLAIKGGHVCGADEHTVNLPEPGHLRRVHPFLARAAADPATIEVLLFDPDGALPLSTLGVEVDVFVDG